MTLLSSAGLLRFDELCARVREIHGTRGLTLDQLRDIHILAEEEVDQGTPDSDRATLCRRTLELDRDAEAA